jgi:hypothetical protein
MQCGARCHKQARNLAAFCGRISQPQSRVVETIVNNPSFTVSRTKKHSINVELECLQFLKIGNSFNKVFRGSMILVR